MSLALHREAASTCAGHGPPGVAPSSAEEAALVADAEVYRAKHLLDVVATLSCLRLERTPPDQR
jgi:magnesium chelatase family protein